MLKLWNKLKLMKLMNLWPMKLWVLTICLFSKAIEVLANILCTRGSEGKKTNVVFFWWISDSYEGRRYKIKNVFWWIIYLSSNSSSKSKDSQERVKEQLLFIWYAIFFAESGIDSLIHQGNVFFFYNINTYIMRILLLYGNCV